MNDRPSPVTFDQARSGTITVRLGMHAVGTIMPRGDGRAYIWACCLPPMAEMRWHSKSTLIAAQNDCRTHIEQWLEGVGEWCGRALSDFKANEERRRA